MALKEKLKELERKTKKASTVTVAYLDAIAQEYKILQEKTKEIETKMAKINKEIKDVLPSMEEVSVDDKENVILKLPSGYEIKLEKRLSSNLDQDAAIEYAERRGLEKKLTYTKVIADMEAFEQLNLQGVISDKDFESVVTVKESVALKIKGIDK